MIDLDKWTTEELLDEVMSRTAGDRQALDLIQVTAMRAILDDCDRKELLSDHWHASAPLLG